MSLLSKLKDRVKSMEQTFRSRGWERTGLDVKRFLVPDRGRFLQGNNPKDSNDSKPEDREYVLDDTGEQALSYLVSGFMSMLVPETSPWLKLKHSNPQLQSIKEIGVWLDDVRDLVLQVFSDADVYGTLYNTFTEFGAFATGCQLLDADPINTLQPRSFTYGEYFLRNGENGKPNTFAHRSYWTARELADRFGEENLSHTVKTHLKDQGQADKRFLVWHLIEPNDGRLEGLSNPTRLPFNSVYFEHDVGDNHKNLLEVKGYHEFPVQAPRWAVISNDVYGKESPGLKQLGNVKMLQSVVEDRLIITKRMGDPPLVATGAQSDINALPGGVTYGTDAFGNQPVVSQLFQDNPNIQALLTSEEMTRELITNGFFNQLFLIVSDVSDAKRMTATDVVSRNEEKFAMLGPILNRVFNELLEPMIYRTINILERQGFFHPEYGEYPMPAELEGQVIDIEFVSVLAQAQKAVGLNAIDRYLERAGIAASLDPSALDAIDMDEVMNAYGQNVPARIVTDQEERDAIRQQRAQQEAAMAQMAAMESAAQTAKTMSETPTAEGTMLEELGAEEE